MSKKPTKTNDKSSGSQSMTNQSMENKKDSSSTNCKNNATDCGR